MTTVLKQNEYKCVELHQPSGKPPYISKRYSGQGNEQNRKNTQYIDQALHFFYQEFSSILQTPRPLSADLDRYEVTMEYLPHLPNANRFSLKNLPKAQKFFERCYEIRDDRGFLRTVHDSVMATHAVKELLTTEFPVSLGFKGDLSENLCLGNVGIMLADIDSICLEPLGLSELVLYAERVSSSYLHPILRSVFIPPVAPVAYKHLTEQQSLELGNAALEVIQLTMGSLPLWIQKVKLTMAHHFMLSMISRFYKIVIPAN